MGTLLVGSIVVLVVVMIIRNMIKDKKAGKSIQCSCGCGHCPSQCHHE
ncbi:FeoB-associated Cys-rich membrane protein [Beduini massiliensis]|nr:FeoB-associated Cys-rich membrane protein [Beduini massiliensis]